LNVKFSQLQCVTEICFAAPVVHVRPGSVRCNVFYIWIECSLKVESRRLSRRPWHTHPKVLRQVVGGSARINPSHTFHSRKLHYAPVPSDRYAGYFAELRSVGSCHDQIRSVLRACSRVGFRADLPLPACI
jgi:hypothetical protein